ncbi:23S rRNA (adenine(2030)-N(6))-methyltransferase RlmJ [Methanothrix sp.]|uniref:23S rRNA (adenine(2030)-N(6))-methyltransferase RlmJ n=1 Tax=Methanothrix sp. TaxID=90426 RepID=UPI003297CCFB
MGLYDHREHVGNSGDVWKHFLLLEVADCLLTPDSSLVYAESHVGRPKYALKPSGDWESGIGRIWPALPLLKDFPYFNILAEFNSIESIRPLQIEFYPGSALLVAELAKRKKADLLVEIWDIDPAVRAAWNEYLDHSFISFHLDDGFSGAMSLLKRAPPGLLFIDPPFTTPEDKQAAEKLFCTAISLGWTVLCWHMMATIPKETSSSFPDQSIEFSIKFSRIGLEYAGAEGCSIRAASPDEKMIRRISARIKAFLQIIR